MTLLDTWHIAQRLLLAAAGCTCDTDGRAPRGALCAACESALSLARAVNAYGDRCELQANREARGALD